MGEVAGVEREVAVLTVGAVSAAPVAVAIVLVPLVSIHRNVCAAALVVIEMKVLELGVSLEKTPCLRLSFVHAVGQ